MNKVFGNHRLRVTGAERSAARPIARGVRSWASRAGMGALIALSSLLPGGEVAPKDALIGTWHGVISGGDIAIDLGNRGKMKFEGGGSWQVRLIVTGKGKVFTGGLLAWNQVAEDTVLAMAKSGKPFLAEGDTMPVAYYADVRMGRRDGQVLVEGSNIKMMMNQVNPTPTLFGLSETAPGMLCGTIIDEKRAPSTTLVLLCNDDAWNKPRLPMPPLGQTTSIACVGSSYHYSVYVPKGYDLAKPAPLVVHFSPSGNATPLSTTLADEFGWVMIGLTESKNGPWEPIVQNRDAALFDIRQRLAIDWRHVIFGGDSGGARASGLAAEHRPDICAGLLCSIASGGSSSPRRIPIFFITGDTDMNLDEVEAAYQRAKVENRPTEMIRHRGGHSNGGEQNITAALRWLHDHAAPYQPPAKPAKPAKR